MGIFIRKWRRENHRNNIGWRDKLMLLESGYNAQEKTPAKNMK